MLLLDAPLTFREFMTHEELPLAAVFRELLTFLQGRPDAVVFGAQAVNAYAEPARMTEDLDVMSTAPAELAEAIRAHLAQRFHVAVRVREVAGGAGLRVYQLRKPKNRHLVDVRGVDVLPPHRVIEGVNVIEPDALAAMKATAIVARAKKEKGLTDRLDLVRLLRAIPALREEASIVAATARLGATPDVAEVWRAIAQSPLDEDEDEDEIED